MLGVVRPSTARSLIASNYHALRSYLDEAAWHSEMLPRQIAKRLRTRLRLNGITSFVLDTHTSHGKSAADGPFTLRIPSDQFAGRVPGPIKVMCRGQGFVFGSSFFQDVGDALRSGGGRGFAPFLFVAPQITPGIAQLAQERGISVIAPRDLREFVGALRQLKTGKITDVGGGTDSIRNAIAAPNVGRKIQKSEAETALATRSETPENIPETRVPYNADILPTEVDISAKTSQLLRIEFTKKGNAETFCVAGWSGQEPNHRWTDGSAATLWCPDFVPTGDDYMLTISATICKPPVQPYQRLIVHVNGRLVGGIVCTKPRIDIEFLVPANYCSERSGLKIEFTLPDAIKPSEIIRSNDNRLIALGFEQVRLQALHPRARHQSPEPVNHLGSSASEYQILLKDLMLQFASLGSNCEFGILQRRLGAEPLGLFRFSSTPLPALIAALNARFDGVGTVAQTRATVRAGTDEWMVNDTKYGFSFHTWKSTRELDESQVLRAHYRKLEFLRSLMIDDLVGADKLFVCHALGASHADSARNALIEALRSYGKNWLLWVTTADDNHPAGTVAIDREGILIGYIKVFAPVADVPSLSIDTWLPLCHNAHRLWSEMRVKTLPAAS